MQTGRLEQSLFLSAVLQIKQRPNARFLNGKIAFGRLHLFSLGETCNHLLVVSFPLICYRAQEVCESGGGRPELPVPKSPHCLCGRKATLKDYLLKGS